MKLKTSIMLSESLLKEIDEVVDRPDNRSVFIEEVIRDYIEKKKRRIKERDRTDLELLNHFADDLNKEAEDSLAYQVDI
ncbi:MAG: hypothetical protein GY950_33580 [bacterium]|nr:hypothetical protein [bacterium]